MSAEALLRDPSAGELDDETVRAELSGNICRCTGYEPIVAAVRAASDARVPKK
jgi:carbon-monoxide dehydrogenase small subunit